MHTGAQIFICGCLYFMVIAQMTSCERIGNIANKIERLHR